MHKLLTHHLRLSTLVHGVMCIISESEILCMWKTLCMHTFNTCVLYCVPCVHNACIIHMHVDLLREVGDLAQELLVQMMVDQVKSHQECQSFSPVVLAVRMIVLL